MSKHTPGPWINNTDNVDARNQRIGIADSRMKQIAYIPTSKSSVNEDFANQNLIAAAPELLAALKGLKNACRKMTSLDRLVVALDKANDAITKAEGGDK